MITMTLGEKRGKTKNKGDDDGLNQEEECTSIKPIGRYIPVELVGMILQRLSVKEAVRLSCLCKSWRATAPLFDPTLRKAPWLLTFKFSDDRCCLWSAEKQQSFILRLPGFVPRTTFCGGSWHGWLLLYNETSIFLFNPFSRACIDLPGIPARWSSWPDKYMLAYMSAPPADPDCILLARFRGMHTLLAWRPGKSGWMILDDPCPPYCLTYILIRGRGLLTFHPIAGRLMVLQFSPLKTTMLAVTSPVPIRPHDHYYLVEFFGDILLVVLVFPCKFQMFRINQEERELWVEDKDIGNQALFLNQNKHGFLATAAEAGCQSNCIYFTSLWCIPYIYCWCVYSLEKQTFTNFFDTKGEFDNHHNFLWITPSLV